MTHNEPWVIAHHGYETAEHAPLQKQQGYRAGHNLIRAHAKAYRLYERKYKTSQKGIIEHKTTFVVRETRNTWNIPALFTRETPFETY